MSTPEYGPAVRQSRQTHATLKPNTQQKHTRFKPNSNQTHCSGRVYGAPRRRVICPNRHLCGRDAFRAAASAHRRRALPANGSEAAETDKTGRRRRGAVLCSPPPRNLSDYDFLCSVIGILYLDEPFSSVPCCVYDASLASLRFRLK